MNGLSFGRGYGLRLKHTCVMSFGDGSQGALGCYLRGDAYEPTPVTGLPSDVLSLSAGHYHSLALTTSGCLWAWGRNSESQLATSPNSRNSRIGPKPVKGLEQVKIKSAFASGVISIALGDGGSLWVWGTSKRGQLGLGKGILQSVLPSRVEALATENIVKVSLGWGHALALSEDGKLFGWGYSSQGRLGQMGNSLEIPLQKKLTATQQMSSSSSTMDVAERIVLEAMENEKHNMPIIWEPTLLRELQDVKVADIACGLDHSLVLCCDGTILSCGNNVYGQLGREVNEYGMKRVEMSHRPVSVSSGLGHSFAICHPFECAEGVKNILSWGWNRSSQLGRSGRVDRPYVVEIPISVSGLEGEIPISVSGGRAHSLALTSKGQVWAWGCGKNGRLGLGHSADENEPTVIDTLVGSEVLQVVSGFDHSLALVSQ